MEAVIQSIRLRLTPLNIIRVIVAAIIVAEGAHSESYWMMIVAVILIAQVVLNTSCASESC